MSRHTQAKPPLPGSGAKQKADPANVGDRPVTLLRARIVLPAAGIPLEDGAVLVRGSKIKAVGQWRTIRRNAPAHARYIDLGDVILLPGLVDAHAHLDYTDMAGQLVATKSFTDWIKLITEAKSGWTIQEYAISWRNGAKMLLESGVTTVADVEAVPQLLPSAWLDTPLRVISFLELTGVRSRTAPEDIVNEAEELTAALSSGPGIPGLAPHAPYSTVPALLRLISETARKRRLLVTIHLAESTEEFEMFKHARGPMFEWLRRNQRDMSDCGNITPVEHLERTGLLARNLLAIHANCLEPHDIDLLAQKRVAVVHCPRSHTYFNHPPFPLRTLLRAGVTVCLGTDSLATVKAKRGGSVRLDMFAEMREFARKFPDTSPVEILKMCTQNTATALGLPGCIGCIAPGAMADMIALPYNGPVHNAEEAILAHEGPVTASVIDGTFVIPPEPGLAGC